MTASTTSSPRKFSASVFNFCKIKALISSGEKSRPSIAKPVSEPMTRLTEIIVLSALITAWFFAASPTSTPPSFGKATTEGVTLFPRSFGIMRGCRPSIKARQEFVVPRSIPTILLKLSFPFIERDDQLNLSQGYAYSPGDQGV